MATLAELTAEIVSAHASGSSITSEELIKNIQTVYNTLKSLEAGETASTVEIASTVTPAETKINFKQIFKKDEVICLICKKGFKTLKRHLSKAHDLKPSEYRKQFNIPTKYNFVATAYSEQRKKEAIDRGQGEILAKARAAKASKNLVVTAVKAMVTAPVLKAPVPAVKVKAPVPACESACNIDPPLA